MGEQIWNQLWPYAVGLFVALGVGQWAISGIAGTLWKKLGLANDVRYGADQSKILGMVEGTLFFSAFLIEKPEFVAFWMGMKTVVKWRHWDSDVPILGNTPELETKWVIGRMAYNLFLLGNALVIAFAATAATLTSYILLKHWPESLAMAIGIILVSCILICFARQTRNYDPLPGSHPSLARNQVPLPKEPK